MSNNTILHTSDDAFDADVTNAAGTVVVDFWAPWCGPCKMIAPLLDQLAEDQAGKVKVVKVNVDENRATPARFGIRGIPTLMLFRDGSLVATKVGALNGAQLKDFLERNGG